MISPEYAAGFLDGEGCITLARRSKEVGKTASDVYQLVIVITNTDIRPLLEFSTRWGGTVRKLKRYATHHRQRYNWRLSAHRSVKLIEEVLPFLIIKGEVAKLCMEVQKTNLQWQYRMFNPISPSVDAFRYNTWLKVKELNRRGIRQDHMATSAAFDDVAVNGAV